MQRFHWPPSVFAEMDEYEKAFVIAAVDRIMKEAKK